MRARRAGTAPRQYRGAGPAALGTAVSCPTQRAARFGASAPNTPKPQVGRKQSARTVAGPRAPSSGPIEKRRRDRLHLFLVVHHGKPLGPAAAAGVGLA